MTHIVHIDTYQYISTRINFYKINPYILINPIIYVPERCKQRPALLHRIRSFVFCIEPPNHVHCVWDCEYLPQGDLSDIWETVTGDSFIVYIKRVDKQRWRGAVKYITKYITKISEHGIGMRGTHVIGSWGEGDVEK